MNFFARVSTGLFNCGLNFYAFVLLFSDIQKNSALILSLILLWIVSVCLLINCIFVFTLISPFLKKLRKILKWFTRGTHYMMHETTEIIDHDGITEPMKKDRTIPLK